MSIILDDLPTTPQGFARLTGRLPQTTVLGVVVSSAQVAPTLCAIRFEPRIVHAGDPLFGEATIYETHYDVLGTEQLLPGLTYPGVAARVNTLAHRLYHADSRGDYHVLVDASDVGRPVVDAIRDSVIPQAAVSAVTVSSGDRGDTSLLWRSESTVGITYLVSRLQAILQGGRLHYPATPAMDGIRDCLHAGDTSGMLFRALALACSGEYAAVRYDVSPDALPSARL